MSPDHPARVAILISGRGSNMTKLVEAAKADTYPAKIVGVLSNRTDAQGLEFAKNAGIKTAIVQRKAHATAGDADAAMHLILQSWDVDLVCLAGFMRILSDDFVSAWHERMLNIHPSLLPKYKGLDTHQRALDAGDKTHGCTVHFVVPELDAGPLIAQSQVPVKLADTAQTLADRVLLAEHELYPRALKSVAADLVAR